MKRPAIRELLLWALLATSASVHLLNNWPPSTTTRNVSAPPEARLGGELPILPGSNSSHTCMSQKALDRVLQQSAALSQQLGLCTTQLATVRTQMRAMSQLAGSDGERLLSTEAAAAQSGGWVEGPRVWTDRSSSDETTAAVGDATGASETTQARTLTGAPPPLGGRANSSTCWNAVQMCCDTEQSVGHTVLKRNAAIRTRCVRFSSRHNSARCTARSHELLPRAHDCARRAALCRPAIGTRPTAAATAASRHRLLLPLLF
jgi:hypothetical protein